MARLRALVGHAGPLAEDHVRILDFYQLFPFRIGDIRLKQRDQKFKKLALLYGYTKPYGQFPNERDIFQRMKPAQLAALDTFSAGAWIDEHSLRCGLIKPTDKPLPEGLAKAAQVANEQQKDLTEFLRVLASEYDLLGPDGLKARSKLLEYRYDAV